MTEGKKHGGGRPSAYKDTDQGLINFVEDSKRYAYTLKESKKAFSYGSWADHLGLTRQTLYNYRNRSEAWKEAIRQCESLLMSATL